MVHKKLQDPATLDLISISVLTLRWFPWSTFLAFPDSRNLLPMATSSSFLSTSLGSLSCGCWVLMWLWILRRHLLHTGSLSRALVYEFSWHLFLFLPTRAPAEHCSLSPPLLDHTLLMLSRIVQQFPGCSKQGLRFCSCSANAFWINGMKV